MIEEKQISILYSNGLNWETWTLTFAFIAIKDKGCRYPWQMAILKLKWAKIVELKGLKIKTTDYLSAHSKSIKSTKLGFFSADLNNLCNLGVSISWRKRRQDYRVILFHSWLQNEHPDSYKLDNVSIINLVRDKILATLNLILFSH